MTDQEVDNNTKTFFLDSGSPQLKKIYLWARARQAAPWGLFGSVLARVSASTPYSVQLPPVIGDYASLNVFCAFVGPSGGGKGKADRVGRRAWPTDITVVQGGSGEGISEMFTERKDSPRLDAAIIGANEIDAVTGLASRQGSILMAELKSAWMGEPLGQRNASKATSRHVKEHDYRLCLSVGAQYGHAGVIFSDTSGGSPQRFYWWPGTDPNMPEGTGLDPGPLDTTQPSWTTNTDGVAAMVYDDPEIAKTVRENDLARNRGQGDALDGHALLARCKLAALLAVMHQRQNVTTRDWELSEIAMQVSDETRNTMLDYDRRAARAKVRERAIARATGEDFYDASRLETVKRSILRMLDRDGEQVGGDLRRRLGKREKRELFDQAIGLLEVEGLVAARPGEHHSVRYRIGSPVTTEVTPYNRSSDGVTTLVTRDQPDNITELDTRRSHDGERPKVPAAKWLADHIAELRSAGQSTVTAFAVYAAGQAVGYKRSTLAQAATAHPDITVTGRSGGTTTWSIIPGQSEYTPASGWAAKYLDHLPADTEIIDQEDFYAAATEAGYDHRIVRRSLLSNARVSSEPAAGSRAHVWRIVTPNEGEAS